MSPLDIGLSAVYLTHFVYPVIFAVALWVRDRVRFYRFGVTLLVVSFAAFFTFLLVPVAPPRFAVVNGVPLPVTDVMAEVSRSFGWGGSVEYVHTPATRRRLPLDAPPTRRSCCSSSAKGSSSSGGAAAGAVVRGPNWVGEPCPWSRSTT